MNNLGKGESEFDAAFAAALQSAPPQFPDGKAGGIPYVITAPGHEVKDLAHLLDRPRRLSGTIQAKDIDTFCDLYKRHENPGSNVYANPDALLYTAVMNDDQHGDPDWRDHRVTLQLKCSPEWTTWTSADKKTMPQGDFARFIEENLPDIVDPDGALLLELCSKLEATKTVKFLSGVNLQNSTVQLRYEETVEGRGHGEVRVPAQLVLGLPPFENGPRYKVTARLRYKITDDKLTFAYALDHPRAVDRARYYCDDSERFDVASEVRVFNLANGLEVLTLLAKGMGRLESISGRVTT